MIRRVLFWTLFPFVLPQAIRIRNNAPRFPGAGGQREGATGKGTRLNLLAIVAVAGIPPLKSFPLLPQPLRALFGPRGKTFDRAAWKMVSLYPWVV